MVMDSNLGRIKLNFLFAKILFGMNVKWQGEVTQSRLPMNMELISNKLVLIKTIQKSYANKIIKI